MYIHRLLDVPSASCLHLQRIRQQLCAFVGTDVFRTYSQCSSVFFSTLTSSAPVYGSFLLVRLKSHFESFIKDYAFYALKRFACSLLQVREQPSTPVRSKMTAWSGRVRQLWMEQAWPLGRWWHPALPYPPTPVFPRGRCVGEQEPSRRVEHTILAWAWGLTAALVIRWQALPAITCN